MGQNRETYSCEGKTRKQEDKKNPVKDPKSQVQEFALYFVGNGDISESHVT